VARAPFLGWTLATLPPWPGPSIRVQHPSPETSACTTPFEIEGLNPYLPTNALLASTGLRSPVRIRAALNNTVSTQYIKSGYSHLQDSMYNIHCILAGSPFSQCHLAGARLTPIPQMNVTVKAEATRVPAIGKITCNVASASS
jgi:hypothetical protein